MTLCRWQQVARDKVLSALNVNGFLWDVLFDLSRKGSKNVRVISSSRMAAIAGDL